MTPAHLPDLPGDGSASARVVSLGQYAPGAPWKLSLQHDLPDNLLIWITRGQGRIVLNGVRRGLGAHNAVFLPRGALFSLDLGPQTLAQCLLWTPGLTGRFPPEAEILRIRDVRAQSELTGLLEAIQRESTQARPGMADAVQAHASLVGVWLLRQAIPGQIDAPQDNAAHRLAHRYAARVVSDYATAQGVGDHAQALGVTPTHLSRVCKALSGLTAAEILTQRKLYEARLRLGQATPPIRQVAASLGFASAAYFTRFMQQHTGLSPSALRAKSAAHAAPQRHQT